MLQIADHLGVTDASGWRESKGVTLARHLQAIWALAQVGRRLTLP